MKLDVTLEDFPEVTLTEEFMITFEEPASALNLNAKSEDSFNLAWILIIVLGLLLIGVTIFAVVLCLKSKRNTKTTAENKISPNDSERNNETAQVAQNDIDVTAGPIEGSKNGDKPAEEQ